MFFFFKRSLSFFSCKFRDSNYDIWSRKKERVLRLKFSSRCQIYECLVFPTTKTQFRRFYSSILLCNVVDLSEGRLYLNFFFVRSQFLRRSQFDFELMRATSHFLYGGVFLNSTDIYDAAVWFFRLKSRIFLFLGKLGFEYSPGIPFSFFPLSGKFSFYDLNLSRNDQARPWRWASFFFQEMIFRIIVDLFSEFYFPGRYFLFFSVAEIAIALLIDLALSI